MLFRGNFARCLYNFSHSSSVSKKQYEANFDKLSSVFSFFFIIIWVFFWFLFWCWIYTIINIRTSINLMVLIINFSPSGVNKYQIESTKMLEWQKNCGKMCSLGVRRCLSSFIVINFSLIVHIAEHIERPPHSPPKPSSSSSLRSHFIYYTLRNFLLQKCRMSNWTNGFHSEIVPQHTVFLKRDIHNKKK